MQFRYSTIDPAQSEFESLPRIPLVLRNRDRAIEAIGLVDSGSSVNILPYGAGIELGAIWDDGRASIRLAGSLASETAMPLLTTAEIEGLPAVKLAFAWVKKNDVPLILGQTNFFAEFDVHFYRSRLVFEIVPKSNTPLVQRM
jgi:hypothetical protein